MGLLVIGRQSGCWARLTKKNYGNGNQDHKNVMITDERYQTLDADGKANTRSHGFGWNVLSCLDNGLRPAGGRWKRLEECRCIYTQWSLDLVVLFRVS
jgi:hypothetical protein